MFAMGSIPQSYAGSIDLAMNMQSSCGIGVTGGGTVDFLDVNPGDVDNTVVTVNNGGTSVAAIGANAGDASADVNGGFALVSTPFTTHISPISITLNLNTQGVTPMNLNGGDAALGNLIGAGSIALQVTATLINTPVPDNTALVATVVLSATC